MNAPPNFPLWELLEKIKSNLTNKRLADVFRFISFYPGETYGYHKHLRIEINYVKKGKCILHLDHESITFREGEMMIINSNVNHLFESGAEGVTLLQLEFLPEVLSQISPSIITQEQKEEVAPIFFLSEQHNVVKIIDNQRITRAVERIVNELKDKSAFYQNLVIMYYAELLILIYRYMNEVYCSNSSNHYLNTAIQIIRSNYNTTINIMEVAEQTGISERYLRDLFTTNLHITPLNFLNQIRINKALELLRNTDQSIKEVSYLCGFKTPQYFSRIFKQQTGFTPKEFKRE